MRPFNKIVDKYLKPTVNQSEMKALLKFGKEDICIS